MHWTDKLTPAEKTAKFQQLRKKVKHPGFKTSEAARKAANKRWHKNDNQKEEPQPIS